MGGSKFADAEEGMGGEEVEASVWAILKKGGEL